MEDIAEKKCSPWGLWLWKVCFRSDDVCLAPNVLMICTFHVKCSTTCVITDKHSTQRINGPWRSLPKSTSRKVPEEKGGFKSITFAYSLIWQLCSTDFSMFLLMTKNNCLVTWNAKLHHYSVVIQYQIILHSWVWPSIKPSWALQAHNTLLSQNWGVRL